MPLVYRELWFRAAARLREYQGTPPQPPEFVHEVYLRLVDQNRAVWQIARSSRFSSQMMRRILVDRARARKNGRGRERGPHHLIGGGVNTPATSMFWTSTLH
jgi:hypothetical protein